ncbi:MAG TPA: hypothetical protein VFX59_22505 [Polyangiales bacterium]|nr:hypothetical protein [Polyangiales bacterium]
MTDSDANQRRVVEWLTAAAKGRQWQIEAVHKRAGSGDPLANGPVYLLNYYAVRYGYDLVLAS